MFITKSLTKKRLEELIKQSFQVLNHAQASSLSDCLKAIGFYYATASGISISLEDLKTPLLKNELMQNIENDFKIVSNSWASGFISDIERFQSVIDNWNVGAELLKQKIIEHFQASDPLNSLYIMAFSGARGNMSQVRQVIGMRGLMVNKEGSIIDLPIKTNFREGLSAIDYIVSSYGARKGVVDTALKTADAGYLTRRLIFVAQEITIKAVDCKTTLFQTFFLLKTSSIKDLIGKICVKLHDTEGKDIPLTIKNKNFYLTESSLNLLKKKSPIILFYRSPLTCQIKNGICQKCYGWDIARYEKINLGLAVGILAAQSIGEPGTQLTMRTFHTGGIFTGQFTEHQKAPFSGKLEFPAKIKTRLFKTLSGKIVPLLLEDIIVTITSWEGIKTFLSFPRLSFLYFTESSFIKKGEILSELHHDLKIISEKKRHPLRAPFDSLLIHKQFFIRPTKLNTIKITKSDSKIRLISGQLYETSLNATYLVKNFLNQNSAFAFSKIVTPIGGLVLIDSAKQTFQILNNFASAKLNFNQLLTLQYEGKIENFIKNFSFIDAHTVIGGYYYYPEINAKIYRIKQAKKFTQSFTTIFFFITEKDIWQIFYDSPRIFNTSSKIIFSDDFLTENLNAPSSGLKIEKNGFHQIYHKAVDISLPQGALISSIQKKFFKKDAILAHVLLSKQKGDDIVQGLPKIEELLEARKTKKYALLLSLPSIFLGTWEITSLEPTIIMKNEEFSYYNFYNVMFSQQNEKFFNLISKIKKIAFANIDKRSIKKVQQRKYFRLNFFQSPFLSENFENFRNANYDKVPLKKFDTFKLISPTLWLLEDLKKIELQPFKNIAIDSFFFSNKIFKKSNNFFLSFFEEKESNNIFSLSFPYIRFPKFCNKKKTSNLSYKQILKEFSPEIAHSLLVKLAKNRKKTFYTSNCLSLMEIEQEESFEQKQFNLYRLQSFNAGYTHYLAKPSKVKVQISEFIDIGMPITHGKIDPHQVLTNLFYYQSAYEGLVLGAIKSICKFQLILLNSIQSVYRSQGVEIANIHVELIVRELTSKVKIKASHAKLFYPNEILSLKCATKIAEIYKKREQNTFFYEPVLFPISKISIQKEGFIAAASFQETRSVLAKAAIEGKKDWIKGLKESIIIGRLIPAGTGFLTSKNYLDNIYYYKNI